LVKAASRVGLVGVAVKCPARFDIEGGLETDKALARRAKRVEKMLLIVGNPI
jgi:hypothetical protein